MRQLLSARERVTVLLACSAATFGTRVAAEMVEFDLSNVLAGAAPVTLRARLRDESKRAKP